MQEINTCSASDRLVIFRDHEVLSAQHKSAERSSQIARRSTLLETEIQLYLSYLLWLL
jgi:hypothetical protein